MLTNGGPAHRRLRPAAGMAALLVAALLMALPHRAQAHPVAVAPRATGLSTYGTLTTPGWSSWYDQSLTSEVFSAPVVGDIDGDGQPDIVAGYPNGHIYAWHLNGQRFLDIFTGAGSVQATPTLVDLTGNGRLDILGANTHGDVFAYTGTGALLFHATTPLRGLAGDFASPVAADLDHNGKMEIIESSWDQYLWAWNLNGSVRSGFPVFLQDTSWSSPAIADLDGDGYPDIVVGYDCYGAPGQACYTNYHQGGGYVTAINRFGAALPGWPRFVPGQVVSSTPAVADLTGDGHLDVIVGTGLYWPAPAGDEVLAFNRAGNLLPGWPVKTNGRVFGSPSVGDVTGNGTMDVAFEDEHNNVYLVNSTGQRLPGWPQCGSNVGQNCTNSAHGSVSLADVTGDGKVDVVAAGQTTVHVWNGAGQLEDRWGAPAYTGAISVAPTLTTLGGHAAVLVSAAHSVSGANSGSVFWLSTGAPLGPAPWPQFRQNVRGTSSIQDITPPTTPTMTVTGAPATTRVLASMSSSDSGSGVASFDGYLRDGSAPLVHWFEGLAPTARSGSTATVSRGFYGLPGHTYTLQARARDFAGNISGWVTQVVTVSPTATKVGPVSELYVAGERAEVQAVDSAPVPNGATSPIYRGVAADPAGGGWLVDLFGGIHSFGGAPSEVASATWVGLDEARGIAVNSDGHSGYTLNCTGGLHPFGGASAVASPHFPGCVARGFVLTAASTASRPAGYVLDEFGGLHAVGGAPRLVAQASWSADVARGLTLDPDGGGYVLDLLGGLHAFGGAPSRSIGSAFTSDRARGVATYGPGSGFVLDLGGALHPYGGAPALLCALPYADAVGLALLP